LYKPNVTIILYDNSMTINKVKVIIFTVLNKGSNYVTNQNNIKQHKIINKIIKL